MRLSIGILILPQIAIFVSSTTAYSGLKSETDCTNRIRCYKNTYTQVGDTCESISQRSAVAMEDLAVWNSHIDCHDGEKLDDAYTPVCVDGRPLEVEDTRVCEQRKKRWAGFRSWVSEKVDKVVPENVQEEFSKAGDKVVEGAKKTGKFLGKLAMGYFEGKATSYQAIGDTAIHAGNKAVDTIANK